mmetsp:Transcript_37302/g.60651  ORF Transcript_37302/g.60651 Transcript_37302/m.60651 type:complete len:386 (-) Transcript_37302:74-1231(-)
MILQHCTSHGDCLDNMYCYRNVKWSPTTFETGACYCNTLIGLKGLECDRLGPAAKWLTFTASFGAAMCILSLLVGSSSMVSLLLSLKGGLYRQKMLVSTIVLSVVASSLGISQCIYFAHMWSNPDPNDSRNDILGKRKRVDTLTFFWVFFSMMCLFQVISVLLNLGRYATRLASSYLVFTKLCAGFEILFVIFMMLAGARGTASQVIATALFFSTLLSLTLVAGYIGLSYSISKLARGDDEEEGDDDAPVRESVVKTRYSLIVLTPFSVLLAISFVGIYMYVQPWEPHSPYNSIGAAHLSLGIWYVTMSLTTLYMVFILRSRVQLFNRNIAAIVNLDLCEDEPSSVFPEKSRPRSTSSELPEKSLARFTSIELLQLANKKELRTA